MSSEDQRSSEHDEDLGPDALAPLMIDNGYALLTLSRAHRGNALSAALVHALNTQIQRAVNTESVHSLVFEGAGRHFCTGFDLSGLDNLSEADLLERFVRVELLLDAIWRSPVRTIAIAHGRCWGAGADLFAACDLRIAVPGSSFRFPGAGFGIVLGSRRLAHRVGAECARRLISEATSLTAEQALDQGLATQLTDPRPEGESPSLTAWRQTLLPPAVAIDRETLACVRRATEPGGSSMAQTLADVDLATLVRSATRDGLKARVTAYRQRLAAQ
jgi:enoyl-CoA hydratase